MDPTSDNRLEPEDHVIFTERLKLRTLRLADAAALLPIISEESVMKWTSHGVVTNVAQAERWTADRAIGPAVFNFAIELRDDTVSNLKTPIIGVAGSHKFPLVGYLIRPDYAGQGYATEALSAILPQLFDRMMSQSVGAESFNYAEGWTDTDNRPSRRILAKCGFVLCGVRADPDNEVRGASQLAIYRKARPGRTLEELGLSLEGKGGADSEPPTPPIK